MQLLQEIHSQARAFIDEFHSQARGINMVIQQVGVQLPYTMGHGAGKRDRRFLFLPN